MPVPAAPPWTAAARLPWPQLPRAAPSPPAAAGTQAGGGQQVSRPTKKAVTAAAACPARRAKRWGIGQQQAGSRQAAGSQAGTHPVLLAQLVALVLHRLQHILHLPQLDLQRLLVLHQLARLPRLGAPPPQLPPRALATPQALRRQGGCGGSMGTGVAAGGVRQQAMAGCVCATSQTEQQSLCTIQNAQSHTSTQPNPPALRPRPCGSAGRKPGRGGAASATG